MKSGVELAIAEVSESESADRKLELTSGTDSRTANWRPGLLGHRYIEARYHHFLVEHDGFIERIDDSEQGGSATFNLPFLDSREYNGHLGIDALFSHRHLAQSGDLYSPPPIGKRGIFERDSSVTLLGASFYVDHARLGSVRPFVQLGLQYVVLSDRVVVYGQVLEFDDEGLVPFIAPGVEVGVREWAALRATFDLVHVKEDGAPTFFGDIILWPLDFVFLRGGIVSPLDGAGIGGTIGAGVEF